MTRSASHAGKQPSRVALIVNPVAGRGRGARAARQAADYLREREARVTVHEAPSPGGLSDLASALVADRPDRLVVVGGDGTLSAILDPLLHTDVPIALVPAGTGNDLARALGVPHRGRGAIRQAAEVALTGVARTIDVGEAVCHDGAARFVTVAALGFDAKVNDRTNRLRWPKGALRYYLALVIELVGLRPMPFVMTIDDADAKADGAVEVPAPGTLVAVGNTRSYGGGMPICPSADPSDAAFDIAHVAPLGRLKLARLFALLLRGTHLGRPEVRSYRAASVRIVAPGLVVYADGERVGTESVSFRVLPGALRVMVPDAVRGDHAAG